jgi:hypothetical protein
MMEPYNQRHKDFTYLRIPKTMLYILKTWMMELEAPAFLTVPIPEGRIAGYQ